jgi:hypothetical protein
MLLLSGQTYLNRKLKVNKGYMSVRNKLENKKKRRLEKQIKHNSSAIFTRKILWLEIEDKYGNIRYKAY